MHARTLRKKNDFEKLSRTRASKSWERGSRRRPKGPAKALAEGAQRRQQQQQQQLLQARKRARGSERAEPAAGTRRQPGLQASSGASLGALALVVVVVVAAVAVVLLVVLAVVVAVDQGVPVLAVVAAVDVAVVFWSARARAVGFFTGDGWRGLSITRGSRQARGERSGRDNRRRLERELQLRPSGGRARLWAPPAHARAD